VIAGVHVLGDPVGAGDEQAVRALMLLVHTARLLDRILLLDVAPLIAIDDAPDTILVDEEIVAITRAQQQRVRKRVPSPRVVLR
jgi:hypothetical protein